MKTIDFVTDSMPRGGRREGAGGVSTWKHGTTKTIRVPIALAGKVLAAARQMDEGLLPSIPTDSSDEKVLDLSGIPIATVAGEMAVKLKDLVSRGYTLKPSVLAKVMEANARRKHGH